MSKILFAMTHVLTTQGWFQPTHLLPQLDLQPDEAENLVEQKQAAYCEHDSPLAKRVHELAASCPDKLLAVEQLSAVSPSDELRDVTPEGEWPTLETFLAAGYEAEDYESGKTRFYENKQRAQELNDQIQKEAAEKKAAETAIAEKDEALQKMAEANQGENPGSQVDPTTGSTTA